MPDAPSARPRNTVPVLVASALALPAVLLGGLVATAPPASAGGPTSWAVVPSPNSSAAAAVDSSLAGTSCTSATFCMAVGKWDNGSSMGLVQALAEQWDGTSWSLVTIPSPPDGTYSPLTSVSCTSSTFCLAVGLTGSNLATASPYAERWNGTTWTLQYNNPAFPLPPTALRGQLFGVSCASPSACMAVGSWESVALVPRPWP